VTNAKGRSAIEMSHKLNISYRAAYLLLHKIRWAFWATPPEQPMTDEFSIDVVWVLKGLRDANDHSPEAKAARQTKRRERLVKRLLSEGMAQEQALKVAKKEYPLTAEPRRSKLRATARCVSSGRVDRKVVPFDGCVLWKCPDGNVVVTRARCSNANGNPLAGLHTHRCLGAPGLVAVIRSPPTNVRLFDRVVQQLHSRKWRLPDA
jgi:hypothetical protein